MNSLDVLMPGDSMGEMQESIASRLPLHRLWLEADPKAWFAEWGPRIRAIATAGPHAPVDDALMGRLPKLEIVASFGVGYDHVDARAAARHGVIVTNTPGVLDDEVADTTIGLMIAAVRRLPEAERYLRAGQWPSAFRSPRRSAAARSGFSGSGESARRSQPAQGPSGSRSSITAANGRPDVPYQFYASLVEMAKASDILIVVAPGGPRRAISSTPQCSRLGAHGVLVNVARGSLVDEKALIEALRTKKILAAGLDVFENEPGSRTNSLPSITPCFCRMSARLR